MNKKMIVSGGGTGGHIFPAIAIANAMKAEFPIWIFCLLVPMAEWR